uniref:Uncharacterized protein n=1 Tax=Chloropicon primus TaxID=1764295 RepID=A0A7S2T6C9_9CHLO
MKSARQKLAAYSAREGEEEPPELTEERHRLAKTGTTIENVDWKKDSDDSSAGIQEVVAMEEPPLTDYCDADSVKHARGLMDLKEESSGGSRSNAPQQDRDRSSGPDFDLKIVGQQVVSVVYSGGEGDTTDEEEALFQSHPLDDEDFDLDAMD